LGLASAAVESSAQNAKTLNSHNNTWRIENTPYETEFKTWISHQNKR
jgi:hypothetical protein